MSPHQRSPIEATKQKAHFITQANTAVYQICMNPTNRTRTTLREIVAERSTRTLVGPQGMSIGKLPVKRGVAGLADGRDPQHYYDFAPKRRSRDSPVIWRQNPLAITEGPLTKDAQTIRWALEHEVGLVFTKGIRPEAAISPSPYIVKAGRSLMNADWSDIGFKAWLDEIRSLESGTPFVVSIAKNYVTPEEATDMAIQLEAAGAPIISMCDYNAEQLIQTVRLGRPKIEVPLMVKLPPFLPNLEEVLKQLVEAGVDAIAAMDSIGPVLEIDIRTGLPILGSQDGTGYLSGTAIRPVTVKYIYEISRFVDVPVVGVGSVGSARDVVEMVMAGATCVGMVAAPLLKGLGIFDRVAKELRQLLTKLDVNDITAVRGLTHRKVQQSSMRYELRSRIDYDLCNYCKLCTKVCFVRAITDTGERVVANRERCVSCGLCASVCPVEAIELTAS